MCSSKTNEPTIEELKLQVAELEKRIDWATGALHAMANEQRHREHGCQYDPVESSALDEIVDLLEGKVTS